MASLLKHPLPWAFIVLISVSLQLVTPIASDEAYFIAWGKTLQAGVYDHPPLPGWISFGIRGIGDLFGLHSHGMLHRLFSLALGIISLWLVARRLRQFSIEIEPALLALVLIPGSLLLFNLYLNDTLLAFFALLFLLSVEAAFRAERNVWLAILFAGLSFGAILLTKYNGAVLFVGMVLAFLFRPVSWRFLFTRFVLISLIALVPFAGHLWWNAQHCGVNLAFNFGFRSDASTGYGPLWLLWAVLLMAGPVGFLTLWHLPRAVKFGFFARIFLATLLVLLGISIWRQEFGANWAAPLGFMAILALAEIQPKAFSFARKSGLILSLVLLLPVTLGLAALNLNILRAEMFGNEGFAHRIDRILDLDNGALIEQVRPYSEGRIVVAMDYGIGASFDNAGFEEVTVFSNSIYGRNQDLLIDFRTLEGRDMVLLPAEPKADLLLAGELFDSFEIVTLTTARRSYEIVLGQGFSYETYRRDWILPVITRLYDKSPFPFSSCFMDKYR